MKAVVFLQNAWSPFYAGEQWPRDSWLEALHRSRSGQRLRVLAQAAGAGVEWWYDNTTPEVAAEPNGVCEADPAHIERVLLEQLPDVIVACGKQAERELINTLGLLLLRGPLLVLPHPAYRLLQDSLYVKAGLALKEGLTPGIHMMRQQKPD